MAKKESIFSQLLLDVYIEMSYWTEFIAKFVKLRHRTSCFTIVR